MRCAAPACLLAVLTTLAAPSWAAPLTAEGAAPTRAACPATCAAPSLVKPIGYVPQIARNGEFRANVTIEQPCSCTRRLRLNLAFTALGSPTTREHSVKLDVTQGRSTSQVVVTAAQLARSKVIPGQYTLGFALRDDKDAPAGGAVSGLPFKFGTNLEALVAKPAIAPAIAADADLSVPFVFENGGDTAAQVVALLVFTRPDTTEPGTEYYTRQLYVPPGGAKHNVRLTRAMRRTLQLGSGFWLVTAAAFGATEQRLGSFPGHLLRIGDTLSQPKPPGATSPSDANGSLDLSLTLKNDSPVSDLVTAVLLFTASGISKAKPIEYKVEGLKLPTGVSNHPILLTAEDRYNLGIRPGRWRFAATVIDRAGKRLEVRSGNEFVVPDVPGR